MVEPFALSPCNLIYAAEGNKFRCVTEDFVKFIRLFDGVNRTIFRHKSVMDS